MTATTLPVFRTMRAMSAKSNADTLTVTAALVQLRGNPRPHFSVTGDQRDYRGRELAGGCLHDEISVTCPFLIPIIRLHLSDDTGTPMHAAANGWYWLAGAMGGAGEKFHGANGTPSRSAEECLEIFASHVRVDVATAERLRFSLVTGGGAWVQRRDTFNEWIDAQASRWQAEADAAVDLLRSLIATVGT